MMASGNQPSQLRVLDTCAAEHLTATLTALQQVQHSLSALDLPNVNGGLGSQLLPAWILNQAAIALPHLQQLHIEFMRHSPASMLPQLPHLTHLTIDSCETEAQPCALAYITQLHSLHISFQQGLFAPFNVTHSVSQLPLPLLTVLHLPATPLHSRHVRWLLDSAPNLRELAVHSFDCIRSCSETFQQDKTWQVQRVSVWHSHLEDMAELPLPNDGLTTVTVHGLLASGSVPYDASLRLGERLPKFRFATAKGARLGEGQLVCAPAHGEFKGPVHLLSAMQPPPALARLGDGLAPAFDSCSASQFGPSRCAALALVSGVSAMGPVRQQHSVSGQLASLHQPQRAERLLQAGSMLGDHELQVLLRCAPNIHRFEVEGITTTVDHSHQTWATQRLTCDSMHLATLARLPQLSSQGATELAVRALNITDDLDVATVLEAAPRYKITLESKFSVRATDLTPEHQPATLCKTLTVLAHILGLTGSHSELKQLSLRGWAVSTGLLDVLSELPPLPELRFSKCVWMLTPESLWSKVPQSCRSLELAAASGLTRVHTDRMIDVCPHSAGCQGTGGWYKESLSCDRVFITRN